MPDGWPHSASEGVAQFLTSLRVVGKPEGVKDGGPVTKKHTPYSLQEITAGATTLTKVWTSIAAAAGGLPALGTLLAGLYTSVTGGPGDASVKVALIASGAALASAVILSIAIIVRGDVQARAQSKSARFVAEGQIVEAILNNYNFSWPTGWIVRLTDGTYQPVKNFERKNDGKVVITTPNGLLLPDEYDAIFAASQLNAALDRTP